MNPSNPLWVRQCIMIRDVSFYPGPYPQEILKDQFKSFPFGVVLEKSLFYPFSVRLGGAVVRALDLRLEVAGSIPAVALSSATLDKLFTHIVQRLW